MPSAIVLGTAQDGGSPQLGSMGVGPPRRVASVALVEDGDLMLVVDISPDVRQQLAPFGVRPSGNVVDDIALTHAHMGHYAGLIHFGREAHNADGVRCWMTAPMADYLLGNQPWRTLFDNGNLVADISSEFAIAGVSVRQIPVPHRADFTDTVGYSINDELLYLPDIDSWEAWPEAEAEIARHRVALIDATFFSADELPGRDISQIPHPLVTDTIDRFQHLDTRIVLTHINHSNPISEVNSAEAALVVAAGMEVAHDGIAISLDR